MLILYQLAVGLVWLCAVGLMIVKTDHSRVFMYRLQAFGQTLVILFAAIALDDMWLYIGAAITVVLKIGIIPSVVKRALHPADPYGVKSTWGVGGMILAALVLSGGGVLAGRLGGLPHPGVAGLVLAALFVTFLHLSVRFELGSIVWAILSLDTVVGIAVTLFAVHLPPAFAMGADGVSLALALVIAYLARWLIRLQASPNAATLEEELTG